jgi:hypothetical protein
LISSARVLAGPSLPSATEVAPKLPDGLDGEAGREDAATDSDARPPASLVLSESCGCPVSVCFGVMAFTAPGFVAADGESGITTYLIWL